MSLPAIAGFSNLVEIGRGGFGVVYRAHQDSVGREVAIKVITGAFDERARARFLREGAAMGALSGHPHIVQVHEATLAESGEPCLVMPFEAGGSLAQRIAGGPLPWATVLPMAVKLSGALATAHAAGILHRDVKPDNVLFSPYDEPQLADFGIARKEGHTTTQTGSITASFLFAPPEVLDGTRPDETGDEYSFGATMHAALAGVPAFADPRDQSLAPMFMRIVTQPPPDLRPLGVPDALCAVVSRMMAKRPDERHGSMEAVGFALQAVEEGLGLPATRLHLPAGRRASSPAARVEAPPIQAPPTQAPPTQVPPIQAPPITAPPSEFAPAGESLNLFTPAEWQAMTALRQGPVAEAAVPRSLLEDEIVAPLPGGGAALGRVGHEWIALATDPLPDRLPPPVKAPRQPDQLIQTVESAFEVLHSGHYDGELVDRCAEALATILCWPKAPVWVDLAASSVAAAADEPRHLWTSSHAITTARGAVRLLEPARLLSAKHAPGPNRRPRGMKVMLAALEVVAFCWDIDADTE